MIALYNETENLLLRPSESSYRLLLRALCCMRDLDRVDEAEAMLQEMVRWGCNQVAPTQSAFSSVLSLVVASNDASWERIEKIMELYNSLPFARRAPLSYIVLRIYAASGRRDAPDKCLDLLNRIASDNTTAWKLNVRDCENAFYALMQSPGGQSSIARKAAELLLKMETPESHGGYGILPSRTCYNRALATACSCTPAVGALLAESILQKREAQFERELSGELVFHPDTSVRPQARNYNLVLSTLKRCQNIEAVPRMLQIIKRMEEWANRGEVQLRPNVYTWNNLLSAFSYSRDPARAEKTETLFRHMWNLYFERRGKSTVLTGSFAIVIKTYCSLNTEEGSQRAEILLREMEDLYDRGMLSSPPNSLLYTRLCQSWNAWNKTLATQRIPEIFAYLIQNESIGRPGAKPLPLTYDLCIEALCASCQLDKVLSVLHLMRKRARDGDSSALPSAESLKLLHTAAEKCDAMHQDHPLSDFIRQFAEEFPTMQEAILN